MEGTLGFDVGRHIGAGFQGPQTAETDILIIHLASNDFTVRSGKFLIIQVIKDLKDLKAHLLRIRVI